jgi:hypothetical protein
MPFCFLEFLQFRISSRVISKISKFLNILSLFFVPFLVSHPHHGGKILHYKCIKNLKIGFSFTFSFKVPQEHVFYYVIDEEEKFITNSISYIL